MRIDVPVADGRSHVAGHQYDVKDLDSGKTVGWIYSRQGETWGSKRTPSWRIELFAGKYVGKFERWEECVAFAEGVEAVLNHMVSTAEPIFAEQSTTHAG